MKARLSLCRSTHGISRASITVRIPTIFRARSSCHIDWRHLHSSLYLPEVGLGLRAQDPFETLRLVLRV